MEQMSIGENAGRLWNILDKVNEISIQDLRRQSQLTNEAIFTAIGWLAREGKVFICEKDRTVFLSNKTYWEFSFFG